jgi:hypothetical protein
VVGIIRIQKPVDGFGGLIRVLWICLIGDEQVFPMDICTYLDKIGKDTGFKCPFELDFMFPEDRSCAANIAIAVSWGGAFLAVDEYMAVTQ